MLFRNLDENGDWMFGRGLNDYVRNNDAVGLNIRTRILSWVSDCFFDLPAGIDWINRLGLLGQQGILEEDIRRIVISTPDVTGINSIDITFENRQFGMTLDVSTTFSSSYVQQLENAV